MSVEFLSDDQAAAYGSFDGEPALAELERYFFLDDVDRRRLIVGGGAQPAGLRAAARDGAHAGAVPCSGVEYLAGRLRLEDASSVKDYAQRRATQWEHAAETSSLYGYRDFAHAEDRLREFLWARAWTRPERPTTLFEQAVHQATVVGRHSAGRGAPPEGQVTPGARLRQT